MKPVKLVIEGINSFTDSQELDFDAVGRSNLFCICGKTGAGKTTIFDSIMFALYGTSNRGTLADMVNLSLMRARVEFEFEADGERYAVERTIKCRIKKEDKKKEKTEPVAGAKRDATTECTLYKFGEPIAKGGEATERLARIIGLDKDEFKNVYMLEQGEYAEFLKKTPAKQTEAIGKIFSLMRYDEVAKRARMKADDRDKECENLDKQIELIGADSPDVLHAVTAEHASLRAKAAALKTSVEKVRAELDALSRERDAYLAYNEKAKTLKECGLRLDEANAALAVAENELAEFDKTRADDEKNRTALATLRDEVNVLAELNAWDSALASAKKELADKTAAVAARNKDAERMRESMRALDDAEDKAKREFSAAVGEFVARVSNAERSAELEKAYAYLSGDDRKVSKVGECKYALELEYNKYKDLAARRDVEKKTVFEHAERIATLTDRIEKYNAELKDVAVRTERAEAAVKESESKLAEAQTESRAAAIRAELADGGVCPVCGGVYHGMAHGDEVFDVQSCKALADEAKNALKLVENEKRECERAVEKVKSELERVVDGKSVAERGVAAAEVEMTALKVTDAHAEYVRLLENARVLGEKYVDAVGKKRDGAPTAAKLFAELDAEVKAEAEIRARISELENKLGDNAGRTAVALGDAKNKITEYEARIAEREKISSALKAKCESARATVAAHTASLDAARRDCPVDMPNFDAEKYDEKKGQLDAATERCHECELEAAVSERKIAEYTVKCETLAKIQAERKTVQKQGDNYRAIAQMTRNKAMLNFVVDEYMAEITDNASSILSVLSSGKYTLSYDSENGFAVTDYLSGGGKRKASTLSGGEMFLASLSVAIAIARVQSKGNNAFFFLDEGFGTLDEELIDTVFAALDILSADCLVGVISHASALIERMPVCVEVGEATDTHGSTIKY